MQVAMRVRFDWMTRTVAAISLTWMAIAFLFLSLHGQEPPSANSAAQASPVVDSGPIAVVPLNSKNPDAAAKVTIENRPLKNFDVMKKHFKAYCSGFDDAKELRIKLMETENAAEVRKIVEEFIAVQR